MTPEEVLEEVKKANLRGRGGAGFPAGRKWEGSRNAPGEPKYVIVNADEGDPGAFMDRALLEGNPHSRPRGPDHRRPTPSAPARATSTSARSTPWRWRT